MSTRRVGRHVYSRLSPRRGTGAVRMCRMDAGRLPLLGIRRARVPIRYRRCRPNLPTPPEGGRFILPPVPFTQRSGSLLLSTAPAEARRGELREVKREFIHQAERDT